MTINLLELNYKKELVIDEKIDYPEQYLQNSEIVKLNNVYVRGNIIHDVEFNYVVNLQLEGEMMIHDANTYEIVPYHFTTVIEETLESSKKTLDLNEFLWHYIVLEVPIKYTLKEDYHLEGDGYQVIGEEEYEKQKRDNPFKDFHIE